MGELAEFRAWEELTPDALGLIFRNLSLREILSVVPRVCKSWRLAVSGPYCWQEIDLQEWCRGGVSSEQVERMLRLLVRRSSGSCRRLAVSGFLNDSLFSFISDYAGSLQSLEMPMSEMSDAIVEQVTGRFSNITFLDISSCYMIGARALKSFGIHCKSLVSLLRRRTPSECMREMREGDDEALAIALSMPELRHLELAYHPLTTQGVLQILSHCQELEFLDIRGCWDVQLDEKLVKEKYAKLRIFGPYINDSYEINFWYEFHLDDSSVYSRESMDDDDIRDYESFVYENSDEESVWDDDR